MVPVTSANDYGCDRHLVISRFEPVMQHLFQNKILSCLVSVSHGDQVVARDDGVAVGDGVHPAVWRRARK